MSSLIRTRRLLIFAALVLVASLLAACVGNDDDVDVAETPDPPAAATTPDTDPTPDADPTPDTAGTPDTDTTPDTDMTPDIDTTPDMDATPDVDTTPDAAGTPDMTPDTAATPDTTPDTAATPDVATTPDTAATPEGTPDVGEGPFTELAELAADVPNFTLEFTGRFENVPDDTGDIFSADLEMMLAQSEPDVYHIRLVSTGDEDLQIEVWALTTATYISESGSAPVELPAGLAAEFAPAEMLMILPPVELLQTAEEVGEDEVDGRTATEYRVDAQQAVLVLVAEGEDVNVSNPQGEMNIWVDDELGIIVQMTADITFDNEDGTEGSIVIDYLVSDIGETDDIEAPTS